MFKPGRWRSEKNKIKAVFKLQFHATQVPQLAKDALTISLVPVEVGKPTVRLEKSAIQDGTCRWENPVYETVKFVQEPKTVKINDKIYEFIVASGSSKAGVLGEVSINFADYFDSLKACSVSLPLKASKSSAVLHITIQRVYGADDQSKEAEENGIAKIEHQDRSLRKKFSDCETDENRNFNSIQDVSYNQTASQISECNGNHVCKVSDGISASDSGSSSEQNTAVEIGLKNNAVHRSSESLLSSNKPTTDVIITNYLEHQRSNTDWSVGSVPDGSLDELTNSSDENLMKEMLSHSSDISDEKFRSELAVLARQAEVSELEIQTLRKQIVKECKRGQDLSKEVISLKEEREALKEECQQLKASRRRTDDAKISSKFHFESDDPYTLLQEIRQELNYEKDLNANLRIQLQKTQESNSELILAVQDLDEMLEQKNREVSDLSSKSATAENSENTKNMVCEHGMDEDEEQKALESLIKEHSDAKDNYLLEQKIIDLYSEIEVYRRDKDELEMQMEQLALEYEISKQENHDLLGKLEQNHLQEQLKAQYECTDSLPNVNELEAQIETLENELKKQEEDFSASLVTINELKSQVRHLEKELEKQAQAFEADLDEVMHARVEQEQRAIRAEDALRKTRLTNASTAERLQEEFRRLSTQMASTFDANEKLAMKAVAEANELRAQKTYLEEMLEKANEELGFVKDDYEEKLKELSSQICSEKEKAEETLLELKEMSKKIAEQKEREKQIREDFSKERLMLRGEIEKLTEDKNELSKQAEEKENLQVEMEKLNTSIVVSELLLHRGEAERNELEKTIASVRKEVDKFLDELNSTVSLKNEKEKLVRVLQSEVETLKAQYNNLEQSLFEDELEKETLRKQVLNLKEDLKKKEELLVSNEKKLKVALDGTKLSSKSSKVVPVRSTNEVAGLRGKIKQLEEQIRLKEADLENSNNSFFEKENDLQCKIEELENKIVELNNENSAKDEDIMERSADNGIKSTDISTLNKLLIATSHDGEHRNLDELLGEMAVMKEKNKSMESDLKDMQNRYSEISLKFAEVEGERQQLVMTIRNLKNVKKN